ncbi:hypothetical protein EI546_04870 [Aequorivita sp. H23M31]|uniref:Uncharacterized protein n=1 Tax=Aequorivita ciconiae TaxID=2494375 RepID=A0A410G1I0_9FLAO|nr:hypothetical protein [Aequorivita sp. H23M31]QAA81100.1 hypothetical protein EI546_04870 [Aequorivita sp. H23M31]
MKNARLIFAIGLTSLLVSCGTSKETTSAKTNADRGRNNVETASTANKKAVLDSRTANTAPASVKDASFADEKDYFNRMYTDLDMSSQQISVFEKEWKSSTDSWKRTNPNRKMNDYERIESQDRILKKILNDSQFESYQQWVRDQAGKR